MAQPQYFEVLNDSNKTPEQHFFSNIEDSAVQYVITPDSTQVQLPVQQISNQIFQTQIVQQSLIQQPIQIQTTPQYTLIKDGTIRTTEGQQIFFVENAITDGVVIEKQIQHTQQPIVLNHQISQPTVVRSPLMKPTLNQQVSLEVIQKPKPMQRPPNPNQQTRLSTLVGQNRQTAALANKTASPTLTSMVNRAQIGQSQLRHGLVRTGQSNFRPTAALVRQTEPTQLRLPLRVPNQAVSNRANLIRSPNVANTTNQRIQGLVQTQQVQQLQQSPTQLSKFNSLGSSVSDSETKTPDEQEAVSLPDGTVVTMTSYKKMLAEQKARNTSPKQPVQQNNQIHQTGNLQQNTPVQPSSSIQSNSSVSQSPLLIAQSNNMARKFANANKPPTTPKKRNPSPRVPRSQQPKTPKNPRARPGAQANQQQQQQQQQQQSNSQGHFSMLSQQQNVNKPQQQQFSSQPPAMVPLSQPQSQQQSQQQQQLHMQPQQKQQPTSIQSPQQQQQTQMQSQQQQQALRQQPQQQQQQTQMQQHQQCSSSPQTQQNQQLRPSQANFIIQPPKLNQKPANQRPLPSFVPSSHIQKIIEETPISEEFADSIRMLVLLENGEQRLITFTLPKEACTIQEILEQVNVPFNVDTNIQVMETNSEGINYIVTVGNLAKSRFGLDDCSMSPQETTPNSTPPQDQNQVQPQPVPSPLPPVSTPKVAPSPPQQKPPEPPKSPPCQVKETPKLIKGMLAVCVGCGFLSEDFNKCQRCLRKLPESVKAVTDIRSANSGQKRDIAAVAAAQQQKHQALLQQQQQQQQAQAQTPQPPAKCSTAIAAPKVSSPQKKKSAKAKSLEDSVHVISSDDEEEESPKFSENLLQKLGNSVTISPKSKEPSLTDIQRHLSKSDVPTKGNTEKEIIRTKVKCRTVRIGSYRCVPLDDVLIDSEAVTLKVPHPQKEKGVKTITFGKADTVKVLVSFNSSLPVIFYYLNPSAASQIRIVLDMMTDSDYYYDPLSVEDEVHRRLTLLPDDLSEDNRNAFLTIYNHPSSIFDELNIKEANDILIKTCPKDVARPTPGFGGFAEIKQLLTYPPEGRFRLTINTEDYMCLGQDQFLNDVIIDFYLTYLVDNLPPDQKSKIHVFSTFFYKRLTTKPTKASRKSQPSELDPTLSPAQKRHARVKKWSKNVNIFEKDFIIVPINENAHWFLAIICFPGMLGCHTWDGRPYKLEVRSRKKKNVTTVNIANVTVSIKQEKLAKAISCDDPEMSDKDEAEGDDSEMESDDSEELPLSQNGQSSSSTPVSTNSTENSIVSANSTPTSRGSSKDPRIPIRQPCILIFDSLSGASRSRVVATLRDYLTCEYKSRMGSDRIFNKDIIKGASPKVPQQNNFTDCGLYLLQYVEQFFKDPIKDFRIPIKEIQNWFEEITVTKKREDIAILIKTLMREYGKDLRLVPDNIVFPTLHGKIIEHEMEDEEEEEEEEFMDEEEEEEEESFDTLKDEMGLNSSKESLSESFSMENEMKAEEAGSPIKPSNEAVPSDFVSQPVVNPKPDLSEFPRQTSRDTLSILKAKRIVRHKNLDGPSVKKPRNEHD